MSGGGRGHCLKPKKQSNNNGNKKEKGAPIIYPLDEVGMLALFLYIFFLLLIFTDSFVSICSFSVYSYNCMRLYVV